MMKNRNKALLIAATLSSAVGAAEIVPNNTFVDNGETLDVVALEPIETEGSVTVAPGGDAIFWSAEKITLKPGFMAVSGQSGYFRGAIDTNFNGYSDMEELSDSDGDGIVDALEFIVIGWSLSDSINNLASVSPSGDFDGDGLANLFEANAGSSIFGDTGDDADGDGVTNMRELFLGMDPYASDLSGTGVLKIMGDEGTIVRINLSSKIIEN